MSSSLLPSLLGGVHIEISDSIDMDALAVEIGLVANQSYSMDIFHAERLLSDSHFKVETNISCLIPVIIV